MAADISTILSTTCTRRVLELCDMDEKNLEKCKKTCKRVQAFIGKFLILVNAVDQKLHLLINDKYHCSYTVSTAKKGEGQEIKSGRTPLGLHLIKKKIGEGADPLAIFQSRINTKEKAPLNRLSDHIVARILRLDGLQERYNKGLNSEGTLVDSYQRYIYIHGTNEIQKIGKPASKGCIRLHPIDMIDLFDQVVTSTLVYIYAD